MTTSSTTSMTLKNVSSGLTMAMTGSNGTIASNAKVMALTGYDLSTAETSLGLSYNVVTVRGEVVQENPASVLIAVDYAQKEAYDEVDLDVIYDAVPAGTSLQIYSTEPGFELQKREILGESNVGLICKNLGPFSASMVISLWITQPHSLTSQSYLSVSISKIEPSSSGPVKKTLLEKIVVKLSN